MTLPPVPEFVTVGVFTNPLDAHLAKGRLEAEGISAHILNEHYIWANWPLSDALGGVKVQVADHNADGAKKILTAHIAGAYEQDLKEEFPQIEQKACPRCGSEEFESTLPLSYLLLVIFTLGLGIIFPMRQSNHTCLSCGLRWKD
ncbi:MAG: putative signal transducing protein [Immundisolibacter sp.]|uniref:putative signal transducing protein n=1 Tax=Immundisolibacter sp. TaxID=1934948 RepID=UPI003EE32F59